MLIYPPNIKESPNALADIDCVDAIVVVTLLLDVIVIAFSIAPILTLLKTNPLWFKYNLLKLSL